MSRSSDHSLWLFAAVLVPLISFGFINLVGVQPSQQVLVDFGGTYGDNTLVSQPNPLYYVLSVGTLVVAAALVYVDMRRIDGLSTHLGIYRWVMLLGIALIYVPVAWYWWERRKFTRDESATTQTPSAA